MQLVKYEPKSPPCIKWGTYLFTFMAYVSLHIMRMSYSQVKAHFQTDFNQSNFFLGLFDGLVYLSLGFGFFFRFLLTGKMNIIVSYAIFVGFASLSYLIIPVTSLVFKEEVSENTMLKEVLPAVGLLIFGFCQFPAWPTLLTLTN